MVCEDWNDDPSENGVDPSSGCENGDRPPKREGPILSNGEEVWNPNDDVLPPKKGSSNCRCMSSKTALKRVNGLVKPY